MAKVLIAIIGEDKDCFDILIQGLEQFTPEHLILLVKQGYEKKLKKIPKELKSLQLQEEFLSNFPHLEEVFMKIKVLTERYKNDALVINVDSDYMTSCLALSSAFVNGVQAIGVLGEKVIAYPIMKFSYYNAINEKKMEILQALNKYGSMNSMEELSKKLKMSPPLLAYHLRGNRDSQGLVEMNLIETEKKEHSLSLKLTELGSLIANGHVDVQGCRK